MTSSGLRLFFFLLCAPLADAQETTRMWTDTTGRTFEGTYLSATPEKVTIQRAADGKAFEIERTRLSKDDLAYVDALVKPPAADAGPRFRPPGFRRGLDLDRMLAGYDPAQSNFAAPWPKSAGIEKEPPITMIEENAEEKRFIYECPHFRLQSDVSLRRDLVLKIATVFEACYQAHHAIPLNNRRTRSPDAPKMNAFLYKSMEDYRAAGGLPGTNGSYHTRGDRFLVPLEALGVKKVGAAYEFDFTTGFHNVYHEIAHQLWADIGDQAGTWMNEGFAEYMACAAYSNGRFNFAMQAPLALNFAVGSRDKKAPSRNLGRRITMPRLQEFLTWRQDRFYEDPNRNYGLGLLMVYFFLHLDGDGSGSRYRACVKACQDGKNTAEALEILLAGRDFSRLEKDVSTTFRSQGVEIAFQ